MRALRSLVALTVLAAGAGAALAWFAAFTSERAHANRLAAETRALRELAGADVAPATSGDLLLCEDGRVLLRGAGRGYGGPLRVALALQDGAVVGVRVLAHQETPGFADILAVEAPWLDSFKAGEVHAVTGATVTSNAVIATVRRLVERARRETCGR